MRLPALLAAILVMLIPSAAAAALYNIVVIDSGHRICTNVNAAGPKAAFVNCFTQMGLLIPSHDAVITASRVCKSTHRVQQVGGVAHWAYDRRLSYATRPNC